MQRLNEYVMTSLRTAEGLNINSVRFNFGEANAKRIAGDAEKFIKSEKVLFTGSSLILTEEGKFFADGIAADLFG